MTRLAIALGAALVLSTCTTSAPPPARNTAAVTEPASMMQTRALGATRETAIEVCEPSGEREYLRRLRCADGSAPQFTRLGSFGSRTPPRTTQEEDIALRQTLERKPLAPGETDYHVLDKYKVECGATVTELYMDMYHCDQPAPAEAPPGFTIVPTST